MTKSSLGSSVILRTVKSLKTKNPGNYGSTPN